jgi:hypothetical protein
MAQLVPKVSGLSRYGGRLQIRANRGEKSRNAAPAWKAEGIND